MTIKQLLSLFTMGFIALFPGFAQQPVEQINSYIEEMMKKHKIAGLSASIVSDQDILLSRGYGYANKSEKVPVTEETIFPIGSTTKLFTATALMQLVEKGSIDLDMPVSTYLPDFSIQFRDLTLQEPTIRQLLNHHSGLPSNLLSGFEVQRPGLKSYRDLPKLLREETMVSAPDTAFAYSNLGYSLLGCIIENVSGMPYEEYIIQHLLKPLGMNNSLVQLPAAPDRRIALGYKKRKSVEVYPIRDIAAGSMLSNSDDMARFLGMILGKGSLKGNQVLSPAVFETMISRQNRHVPLDRDFSIGLGFWLIDPIGFNGERLASHGGELPPFHSILITMPDAGIGVFLSANTASAQGVIIQMASHIVKTLYTAKTGKKVTPAPLPEVQNMSKNAMNDLAGYYVSSIGLMEVKTGVKGMKLKLGGIPLQLIYHGENQFSLRFRILGIIPIKSDTLDSLGLTAFTNGGKQYLHIAAAGVSAGIAERFIPGPVNPAWIKRAGKYDILNPLHGGSRNKVRNIHIGYDEKKGLLLFTYQFGGQKLEVPLAAPDEGDAIIAGIGSGLGDTISVQYEDGEELLRWSGFYLKQNN